jgi:TonB family protein
MVLAGVGAEGVSTMAETWKQWEGQVVDGLFPLRQLLSGGEHNAIFLTDYGAHEPRAAIKLVPVTPGTEESLLSQWAVAERLAHPHLIRILQSGRCRLHNRQILYLVMEFADENLSQVLADRPLTPGEANDMLRAVLGALEYLHGKDLAHGHVRPANIMAVGDELRLSTDRICGVAEPQQGPSDVSAYDAPELAAEGHSAAGDIWALGVTLVETLTRRLPTWAADDVILPVGMPEPFAQIARECLQRDPRRRCSIGSIRERLESAVVAPPAPITPEPIPSGSTRPQADSSLKSRWRYALLGGPVLALLALLIGYRLFNSQSHAERATAPPPAPSSSPSERPTRRPAPRQKAPPEKDPPQSGLADRLSPQVLTRVLPEVSGKAVNTIHGTVRVNVKIQVNPDGTVGAAKLTGGASKYFAAAALEAARRWRFVPGTASSDWILRFEFRRDGTKVFPSWLPSPDS